MPPNVCTLPGGTYVNGDVRHGVVVVRQADVARAGPRQQRVVVHNERATDIDL